ncbi:LrgA family protein [Psychromonas sp. CNPT3]|uniref:CidA/LrgA family protein n=1 Tax=Psychromonas sp. CNPT3 TaxID=314282 RepID=UPI00006E34C0|nr:CidA/LrgA family protein [Psychromonas sp. CNPT3]AGH80735.1 LrgA family protein [Psychromonas sp. CNPT3]
MKTLLLKNIFEFMRGLALIFLFTAIGKAIAAQLPMPFPGSIIALILLFLALSSGIVKLQWIVMSANVFLKYMVILFVPLAVGLINYFDVILENWVVIVFSIVFTTSFILISVGHLFQFLDAKRGR